MSLASVVFVQQVRTPSSEVWVVDLSRGGDQIAQVDIHYPPGRVEVTVAMLRPVSEADLAKLLDLIDDELISAGQVEKGNLNFRVIQGGRNTAELLKRGSAGGDDIDLLGGFGNG